MIANTNIILLALAAAAPLVSAHGKVAVVTGNLGGNGTAFGIKGGVVPGAGENYQTEPDTTVFYSTEACGYTDAAGNNEVETGTKSAMALSGDTLPQISTTDASVSGTFHIVTSDGAGPLTAYVDPTGKGDFSKKITGTVTTQVPGNGGNIQKTTKRWEELMIRAGLKKRATNINEDFPFAVKIPDGTTCTGTAAGQSGVCTVKLTNSNNAGPFGGCFSVQQSNSTTAGKFRKSRGVSL